MQNDSQPLSTWSLNDAVIGASLVAITGLEIASQWGNVPFFDYVAAGIIPVFLLAALPRSSASRLAFIFTGLLLVVIAAASRDDWLAMTFSALEKAAFIAAFFTALTFLRHASATSPSIQRCGLFLAEQPPGRRYVALTVGGHLFALLLNYGAISLLGTLAEASARSEPSEEIRRHRTRRMLLAIQRGFVSTLPWSPLAFAIAITTSLVPGANWGQAVGSCLVSALILAGLGWALDTIFKPRLSVTPPPRQAPKDSWASLLPLFILLSLLVVTVGGIHIATDVRSVAVVMVVVPIISLFWIALQHRDDEPVSQVASSSRHYVFEELPIFCPELVLLTMAGFIGTIGSQILVPIVAQSGLDLTELPGWVVLVSLVWILPIMGQLGMNPILSVSLIAPLLPTAAAMGVTPTAVITAITAGWALCGASSPFTATTMLVGKISHVSAVHVGLKWNGFYTLLCAIVLSVWVVIVASS